MSNKATENFKTTGANLVKDHKLIIENQRKASVTSVVKAISANQQSIVLQLGHTKLQIMGSELFLSKLDVVAGLAEVEGKINTIKYAGGGQQKNFLARLFK